MDIVGLLGTAEIETPPPTALGAGERRVVNRAQLRGQIASQRKMVGAGAAVLFIIIACALAGAIVVAFGQGGHAAQSAHGAWPYVGGAAFMGLIAAGMKLLKNFGEMTLPLMMLEHADEEQLAGYIDSVLKTKRKTARS